MLLCLYRYLSFFFNQGDGHGLKAIKVLINLILHLKIKQQGFDAIASTGEEVVNPRRNIPLSILITLIVVSVLYCFLSAVLTLMIPYYLIDASKKTSDSWFKYRIYLEEFFNFFNKDTPLPQAFAYVGYDWAKYIVSVGAILSLACWYVL